METSVVIALDDLVQTRSGRFCPTFESWTVEDHFLVQRGLCGIAWKVPVVQRGSTHSQFAEGVVNSMMMKGNELAGSVPRADGRIVCGETGA